MIQAEQIRVKTEVDRMKEVISTQQSQIESFEESKRMSNALFTKVSEANVLI